MGEQKKISPPIKYKTLKTSTLDILPLGELFFNTILIKETLGNDIPQRIPNNNLSTSHNYH